jgi:hypothetical protein
MLEMRLDRTYGRPSVLRLWRREAHGNAAGSFARASETSES